METIRCDYAQVEAIAHAFAAQAEQVDELRAALKHSHSALSNGWLGAGAVAFHTEMEGKIYPALGRLAQALRGAREAADAIIRIFQQAEEEAAAPFKGTLATSLTMEAGGLGGSYGGDDGEDGGGMAKLVPPGLRKPLQQGSDELQQLRGYLQQFDALRDTFIPDSREGTFDFALDNLSPEDQAALLERFRQFDTNGDGVFSAEEQLALLDNDTGLLAQLSDLNGDGQINIDDLWLDETSRTSREFPVSTTPFGADEMTAHSDQDASERTTSFQYGIAWHAEDLFAERDQLSGTNSADLAGPGFSVGLLDHVFGDIGLPSFRSMVEHFAQAETDGTGSLRYPNFADADVNAVSLGHFYHEMDTPTLRDPSMQVQTDIFQLQPTPGGGYNYADLRPGDMVFLVDGNTNVDRYGNYSHALLVVGYDSSVNPRMPIVATRATGSNRVEYVPLSAVTGQATAIDVGRIVDSRVADWTHDPSLYSLQGR